MITQAESSFDPRPAMQRVLLACLPGALALLWFNGWGVLIQLLLASLACCGCDALVRHLRRQPRPVHGCLFNQPALAEGSGLVTAVLLALSLPALAPWWLTVSAAAFASLFGKSLFGGFARKPLNPAMLGYAFALLAFPAQMVQWPAPGASVGLYASAQQILGLGNLADAWSQATVLDALRHNDRLTIDELFSSHAAFGNVGGRGAEWVNLAFLCGGLLLLGQKVIRWQVPIGMLGALFIASLLCWGGSGSDSNGSPLLHLFSGATMLCAFFIATEPVSGASSARGQLCFGIGVGLLVYLIRTWGDYPDGAAFAVLLMNLCARRLDTLAARR